MPSPTGPALLPEGSESGQSCPEGRSVLAKAQKSHPSRETNKIVPTPGSVAASTINHTGGPGGRGDVLWKVWMEAAQVAKLWYLALTMHLQGCPVIQQPFPLGAMLLGTLQH